MREYIVHAVQPCQYEVAGFAVYAACIVGHILVSCAPDVVPVDAAASLGPPRFLQGDRTDGTKVYLERV